MGVVVSMVAGVLLLVVVVVRSLGVRREVVGSGGMVAEGEEVLVGVAGLVVAWMMVVVVAQTSAVGVVVERS